MTSRVGIRVDRGLGLGVHPGFGLGWRVIPALLLFSAVGVAQQPAAAAGTGIVTGHVTSSDTQRPARFAHVVLFGIPQEVTAAPPATDPNNQEALAKAMEQSLRTLQKVSMVQAQTGTDGSFAATDVAPGDYYAFATQSGYISPMAEVRALYAAGADMKKQLPGVPVVHVAADRTSSVELSMERGAAISGTVLWDDGTPVPGAILTVLPTKGDDKPPQQFAMLAMANILGQLSVADDLGHFRISGLAPGDYIVQATIQAGTQSALGGTMNLTRMIANKPLVVYAPAAFHKAQAKTVTLTAGEDLRDQQITLNLGGMHSVSGTVEAIDSHHGINSAVVALTDTQDKEFSRSTSVDAAGNFTITFVPSGTYTLTVSNAADTEPMPKDKDKPSLFANEKTLRSYQNASVSVLVTDSDVTGQVIDLAVNNKGKAGDGDGEASGSETLLIAPHTVAVAPPR